MPAPILQVKRGLSTNVGLASFRAGEPGFTTDKYDFYIGLDGTSANQKFFGSARYWTRETGSVSAILKLVDQAGSNSVNIKSPNSLAGSITYVLPGTQGASSSVLTNDGSGNLSWGSGSSNATFTGITTFSDTTDSTTSTNGAVQISGGLGVAKSVNIGGNLRVTGVSTLATLQVTNNQTIGGTLAVTGETTLSSNLAVTGVSTFTGAVTFNGTVSGTISTATRATTVDTTTAPNGTFYPGLFVNATGTASTSVYVDSGISYVSNTDTLTLAGNLAVNGGTVSTTGVAATVFNTNATTVNAFGAATTLGIGSVTGTATINNQTLTLPNATTVNVNGANPTVASSATGTLTLFNTNLTTVNAFGAATSVGIGAATGTATINNATVTLANATTFNINGANPTVASSSTGTLTLFNTNLTGVNAFGAATAINIGATTGITTVRNSLRITNSLYDSSNSAGSVNQFLTVTAAGIGWTTVSGISGGSINANTATVTATNTQTGNIVFATAGASATLYNDTDLSYNSNTNTLTGVNITASTQVATPAVKAADGTSAISITNTTGAVGFANSVTINGDLYIIGNQTQVETTQLKVQDSLIDLALIQSGGSLVPPTSNLNLDIGMLMNWYSASAKKAGVFWKNSTARITFGSDVTESSGVVTTVTYAPIEIGALWANDTAGQSAVVSYLAAGSLYTGSPADRYLQNITVDAGTF